MTESAFPQEIIRRKRDGAALSEVEIAIIARGLADGGLGEGQAAAFAMAVYFQGMTRAETVALTRAMTATGTVLDWRALGLDAPVLDKHSTGGVGDKVSLILAPLVAACGGVVPMIAGRGLGHTGGTLDKLDSIPGYDSAADLDRFRRAVRESGCAIIGPSDALAPADRRFYAIRDVTATVDSIPLITASILSKKLAAGLDALVMDVKVGNGAFMTTLAEAEELAESIVAVAAGAGLATVALITDMTQVLGRTAGNALEVGEAIDLLTGRATAPRLRQVTLALAGEMLALGGLAGDPAEGRKRAGQALDDGAAAERFARMVAALGGPRDLVEAPARHLPAAPVRRAFAPGAGYLAAVDTGAVGRVVMALGGGRRRAEDAVDPAVGLADWRPLGAEIAAGDPVCTVHARDEAAASRALTQLAAAVTLAADTPPATPVIQGRLARA